MSFAPETAVTLRLTPNGHLLLTADGGAPAMPTTLQSKLINAFAQGAGHGLLFLGSTQVGNVLPPVLAWWRDFAARYVTALCATAGDTNAMVATPDGERLEAMILDAAPMQGAEYLTSDVLVTLWVAMDAALHVELETHQTSLSDYLKSCHPAWNLVGRVYFNLAENRKDADAPFAFLATYTSRLSAHGKAQHLPLSKALSEFSDGKSQAQLLSLLKPVQEAATQCPWLHAMVQRNEIYHPLRWSPQDAFQLLSDVPKLEAAGIVVRAPLGWGGNRPARPLVKASVGAKQPSLLGANALLDFSMEVTLEGEPLTAAEIKTLLKGRDGLQWIRGRWVEVDRDKLQRMMARFESIEAAANASGLPFSEAMRLMAGASLEDDAPQEADWSQLVAGPWLAEVLQGLRQPEGLAHISPGADLKANLRPYQQAGVRWLYLLTRLGLGACLADDMGLGKTIQVLALLLVLKREEKPRCRPSLLVAPASLLANWAQEAQRFAPDLRVLIVHSSALPATEFRSVDTTRLASADLVITSYAAIQSLVGERVDSVVLGGI